MRKTRRVFLDDSGTFQVTPIIAAITIIMIVGLLAGCGRIRQATSIAKAAADMAKTGEELESDQTDGIDWENYDLTESDVRTFYTGVRSLQEEHPDIDFEIAMTAAIEAMGAGVNIERVVEKETDMSFQEYNGLSLAITLALSEAESVRFTNEFVSSMEAALAEADSIDESALSEEEKAAIEEQRNAVAEARAEMDSPEFQAHQARADMVMAIREEMGF